VSEQLALMEAEPIAPPAKDVDWYNEYCRKTYGVPEDWKWFRLQAMGKPPHEFTLVTGAVCTGVFERGPRKGNTDWKKRDKKTEVQLAIPRDAMQAFQAQWEIETGRCSNCYGRGQEWCGWAKGEGHKYRPCSRCEATGAAVNIHKQAGVE
jgi:hypothetical protein